MIRIISTVTQKVYEIEVRKAGENPMRCPECSADRKRGHQTLKCFSWNDTEKVGKCQNCQASFFIAPEKKEKVYSVPEWKNITALTDKAVQWFTGRMISQKTINKMKIYSDNEWMPQSEKVEQVMCFPYFNDEKLINIKYRGPVKMFKLFKDAELILYNINAIKGKTNCVIVEGEMDCLSYVTVGVENCVSVPNGAANNLDYLDEYIELFDSMQQIYLATDNDSPGMKLRAELIRRFGVERCLLINLKDCKDPNEYLMKYGGIALADTLKDAIEIPITGIVNLNMQYDSTLALFMNGMERGMGIGNELFDKAITWETGRLAVVTGIPSHGKSEVVDYILTRLNVIHKMKVAYFSPENYPIAYHMSKLISKLVGKQFSRDWMKKEEMDEAYDYISDNFFFIFPEDDMSFETIIDKAKYLVKKRGIKVFVIDPYNKIEHLRDRNESETEYISRFLDRLTMFARVNNVLVILVAHPRKMGKENGKHEIPSLYDINGSANFYNKCDYGISVYRLIQENETHIHVLKIKFKHLGDGGAIQTVYNYKNGRYEPLGTDVNSWDNSNYLHQMEKLEPAKDEWENMEVNDNYPY